MQTFIGKFLVRRATMKNGQEAFILCGTALPKNFPVTDIKDTDEVWCAELMVVGVRKYVQREVGSMGYHGTPEDFLEESPALKGEFSEWKPK